ncbi:ABC transporter permease [Streptomyces sp. KL116D]|uniref:ABC transporter permease n=1 Tax=Streptomyces sp. KL116D TaxID=3045152 RepID=UPI003559297E
MRTRGRVSRDALEQMLHVLRLQPDQNVVVQYVDYLGHMFTGNWGRSIGQTLGEPVTKLDRRRPCLDPRPRRHHHGAGLRPRHADRHDRGLAPAAAPSTRSSRRSSSSPRRCPYFWVGLLLILVFSQGTGGLLPANFNYDTSIVPGFSSGFVGSVLAHAVLPAATLLITTIGGWILTMRNNMITTLAGDYVRMARAKGLGGRRIMYAYAARNAILPNLAGFAMSLGFVISGAILIEYVFNYPGVGYLLYNAVQNVDYPLMQALFMLFTVAVLVALLAVDIATVWLDLRARARGEPPMTTTTAAHRTAPRQGRAHVGPEPGSVARHPGQPQGPHRHRDPVRLHGRRRVPRPVHHGLTTRTRPPSPHASTLHGPSAGHHCPRPGHLLPTLSTAPANPWSSRSWPGALATVLSVIIGVSAAYLGGIADDLLCSSPTSSSSSRRSPW